MRTRPRVRELKRSKTRLTRSQPPPINRFPPGIAPHCPAPQGPRWGPTERSLQIAPSGGDLPGPLLCRRSRGTSQGRCQPHQGPGQPPRPELDFNRAKKTDTLPVPSAYPGYRHDCPPQGEESMICAGRSQPPHRTRRCPRVRRQATGETDFRPTIQPEDYLSWVLSGHPSMNPRQPAHQRGYRVERCRHRLFASSRQSRDPIPGGDARIIFPFHPG